MVAQKVAVLLVLFAALFADLKAQEAIASPDGKINGVEIPNKPPIVVVDNDIKGQF